MLSRWRAVSESSAMKGATYCVAPPRIARMTFCTTSSGARVLRHQWCTTARRSRCLRCRENPHVRLQLESQVGDGVRRWYPLPWVFEFGTEAQLQAWDPLCGGHGTLAGGELHAHHPQVCGHRLHAPDEVLQHVGHYQQVVYVGLDEAPFGLSRRAQTVPRRPELGLQEERVQQGALGVALPDTAQYVDGLFEPVGCDNAQPGARVEEESEVDDLRRHREVAQDEVEGAVRGGVESLGHEQWGAAVGAGKGPLLPVADHSVPCEHFVDALGEGAREQLHVQLA